MNKVEHIGIAVRDIQEAVVNHTKLLGVPPYKQEEVLSEGVITAFFQIGETKIELLQATTEDSAIAKSILKRGEGIHHIAYAVTDILSEIARLKSEGFVPLNQEPKEGADNKLICFLHPKETNGVLVELCQDNQ